MNREEIVNLLTYAAACDQRTVGEADVLVWFDMLAPLDFRACLDAMRMHYRRNPDVRLKPGHLWQLAATRTDGEDFPNVVPCEQGQFCHRCKLVHHQHEDCSVLKAQPWPRAIGSVVKRPDDVPSCDDESPEVGEDAARAMEAERRRQLAELAALATGDVA